MLNPSTPQGQATSVLYPCGTCTASRSISGPSLAHSWRIVTSNSSRLTDPAAAGKPAEDGGGALRAAEPCVSTHNEHRERDRGDCPLGLPGGDVDRLGLRLRGARLFRRRHRLPFHRCKGVTPFHLRGSQRQLKEVRSRTGCGLSRTYLKIVERRSLLHSKTGRVRKVHDV